MSPAKTSAAKTGTAKTGTAKTGTAKAGAARSGAAKSGAAKSGTKASTARARTAPADGTGRGAADLPAEIFDAKVNVPLIHQVVVAQQAAARQGTHPPRPAARCAAAAGSRTARRAPAAPGRARSARRSSPAAASCTARSPRSYEQRTPKKMKAAALRGALSDRARHGLVHVVSSLVEGDDAEDQGRAGRAGRADRRGSGQPPCWSWPTARQGHLEEPAQRARRAPARLGPAEHLRRAGQRPRGLHPGRAGQFVARPAATVRADSAPDARPRHRQRAGRRRHRQHRHAGGRQS